MKITIERKHILNERTTTKVKHLNIPNLPKEKAIEEALMLAGHPQVRLFGDTGMADGQYIMTVTHIDDVPI
jgi:hypothetical protein